MAKKFRLKHFAAPPPIPQDARKPATNPKQTQLDQALLQQKGDDMLEMAADLVTTVMKLKNAFDEKGKQELTMLAAEVKSLYKRNPQAFGEAMQYLRGGVDAYTAINKVLGDQSFIFKKNFEQLYSALDTFRTKKDYGALPKEQLLPKPTKRNLIESLMVRDQGLSPEEAKGRLEHMSDADIDEMLPDDKFKAMVGADVKPMVWYKGRQYRLVQ
jgi:hypothetical protein